MTTAIKLKKTGYERKGFDNLMQHLCAGGFANPDFITHHKPKGYCSPIDKKEMDLSTEWLSKYATKYPLINFSHSSYGLKHDVEHYTESGLNNGKGYTYISNGPFILAAIEAGYEYITDTSNYYHGTSYGNAYFNINIRSPKHHCIPHKQSSDKKRSLKDFTCMRMVIWKPNQLIRKITMTK